MSIRLGGRVVHAAGEERTCCGWRLTVAGRELREHLAYWTDDVKVSAYRGALARVVTPESVVLDLGCGTGLLGLLACEAGAARVYAVDAGPILALARELASANGFADRIVHIRGWSTEIDLPEPVDVIVADQMGGLAYDAGAFACFEDAKRFLKPDGVFVPSAFELMVTAVESAEDWSVVGGWQARGTLDSALVARYAANTLYNVHTPAKAVLSRAAAVGHVVSGELAPVVASCVLEIERPGVLHGLLGTFKATMAPELSITNDPVASAPLRNRWRSFLPLSEQRVVSVGDRVVVDVDLRPRTQVLSWKVRVECSDGTVVEESHSTFYGAFLSVSDMAGMTTTRPFKVAIDNKIVDAALALSEGRHTIAEVSQELANRFPERLPTEAAARRFVTRLSDVLSL